jgi:CDP-glucose 4,6-dehydratase
MRESRHGRSGDLMSLSIMNVFRGRKVLVTGHTGFKGAWLSHWLERLGAHVRGYSLEPPTNPSLYAQLELNTRIDSIRGDIRDLDSLCNEVKAFQPQFVFHLAAQSLVRLSYQLPRETYETNVLGTVNLLEALRQKIDHHCSVVIVTSDKCYENREWIHAYRENDHLGGFDPYSSSKGATELVAHGYRQSFFSKANSLVSLATARAGNVIGGGDWAQDRIVPDCVRSLKQRSKISIRNKFARRPWQHVLEPLSGYLCLASAMSSHSQSSAKERPYESAFNFGPRLDSNRSVMELVESVLDFWPLSGEWIDSQENNAVHEANLLNLSIDKAFYLLKWHPVWDFDKTISMTISWYHDNLIQNISPIVLTDYQIGQYTADARALDLTWASEAITDE